MVEQSRALAPDVSGEVSRTGEEVLAEIHSTTLKDLHVVTRRDGIYANKPVKKLKAEFIERVLGDERITKEDLARLLVGESVDASFGRKAREYPNNVEGTGGWNPLACR